MRFAKVLMIGASPVRLRPLMIASMVEKFGHVLTVAVLYGQARLSTLDALAAGPDLQTSTSDQRRG